MKCDSWLKINQSLAQGPLPIVMDVSAIQTDTHRLNEKIGKCTPHSSNTPQFENKLACMGLKKVYEGTSWYDVFWCILLSLFISQKKTLFKVRLMIIEMNWKNIMNSDQQWKTFIWLYLISNTELKIPPDSIWWRLHITPVSSDIRFPVNEREGREHKLIGGPGASSYLCIHEEDHGCLLCWQSNVLN